MLFHGKIQNCRIKRPTAMKILKHILKTPFLSMLPKLVSFSKSQNDHGVLANNIYSLELVIILWWENYRRPYIVKKCKELLLMIWHYSLYSKKELYVNFTKLRVSFTAIRNPKSFISWPWIRWQISKIRRSCCGTHERVLLFCFFHSRSLKDFRFHAPSKSYNQILFNLNT